MAQPTWHGFSWTARPAYRCSGHRAPGRSKAKLTVKLTDEIGNTKTEKPSVKLKR
jgi:hypothetical protein